MEQPTAKLCSKCRQAPVQAGQRWCRGCRSNWQGSARKTQAITGATDLATLTQDDHNANRGTDRGRKVVAASIRDLGFGRSVLTDRHGNIIAGNKTVEQAMSLGNREMVVVPSDGSQIVVHQRMDLDLTTDAKAKKLGVADDRSSELGLDWDAQVMKDMMPEMDFAPLFTDKEMGRILSNLTSHSTATDEAPDRPETPTTKRGDRVRMGNHILVCGDALETADVEQLLEGAACLSAGRTPTSDSSAARAQTLASWRR